MGDQDDCEAVDLADCLPALFTILDAVLNGQVQRVEEDAGRDLKAETVLALIGQVLVLVPGEEWRFHESNVVTKKQLYNTSSFTTLPRLAGSGLNWLKPVMRTEVDPLRKQRRTMEKLSLNKAAKEASVAKSTLLEALNSGRMSAGRNDKGHWQIDPSELFRVFPRTGPAEHVEPKPTPSESLQKTAENGALEVEVKMLREQIERMDVERERERSQLTEQIEALREQFERQSVDHRQALAILTDHRQKAGDRVRPGFWARFGRP